MFTSGYSILQYSKSHFTANISSKRRFWSKKVEFWLQGWKQSSAEFMPLISPEPDFCNSYLYEGYTTVAKF